LPCGYALPCSLSEANRCSFERNQKRRRSAPNVEMRCGLPESYRQCARYRGWSSIYADGVDASEPASVSPSRHRRNGFNRNAAHDIPYFAPPRASANDRISTSDYPALHLPLWLSLNRSTAALASSSVLELDFQILFGKSSCVVNDYDDRPLDVHQRPYPCGDTVASSESRIDRARGKKAPGELLYTADRPRQSSCAHLHHAWINE
jgi:hypothetical protein